MHFWHDYCVIINVFTLLCMKKFSDNLIKILSLGIGLAIGIVLIAKVCFELSYDGFYKDVDRIYRITEYIRRQWRGITRLYHVRRISASRPEAIVVQL